MKRPFSDVFVEIENLRCARCGKKYYGDGCVHTNTSVDDMTDEEAERVQARYALGKLHNPEHDTANYRD